MGKIENNNNVMSNVCTFGWDRASAVAVMAALKGPSIARVPRNSRMLRDRRNGTASSQDTMPSGPYAKRVHTHTHTQRERERESREIVKFRIFSS